MNIFQAASKFFRRLWARRAPVSVRSLTPVQTARLVALAESASDEELSCEEAFALVDQYAECIARGEDAAALMPLVKEHLQRCTGCQEELEALLRMIHD